MQDIISTLKNALLQAEAGLEVAVGRLTKDGTERGDFKPSEVLALASVREALAMPVTCLHQIQEPAEYPHLPSSAADVVDFGNGCLDVDFGDPAPAGGTSLYSAGQMRAYVDADRAQRPAPALAATAAVAVPDLQDMLRELRVQIHKTTTQLQPTVDCSGVWMAHDKMAAALAATPAAAPAALTTSQPFGYVVTTPAGVEIFYRHPADLTVHNDHWAETVYTLPAVLAAAPVVLPEPDAWREGAKFALKAVAEVDSLCWLTDSMKEVCIKQAADAVIAERDRQRALLAGVSAPAAQAAAFQQRVQPWMMACFGSEISADRIERNHRFLEESLELVQSLGCTGSEAHQLVDYVFGRPVGEPMQEAGGVMVTLAALCLASGLDMHACGETELARIWTKVEAIRAKQAAKPKHSPLPMHAPQAQADARDAAPAASELDAPITWPKARDVGRFDDMSPGDSIRVGLDSDNDVYVSVCGGGGVGSVEFCNLGGGGGGKSSRTRLALLALMVAMEADNADDPARDWWARRNTKAAQQGGAA